MADRQWDRVKQIIDAFWEEAPSDPEAWLKAQCDGNEALRREVESLLRADAQDWPLGSESSEESGQGKPAPDPTDGFPAGRSGEDMPAVHKEAPSDARAPADQKREGAMVGPYRLLEEIGVGGMSTVYRAERADGAFDRTVAVKLMRHRFESEETRRRFQAERQVLASLEHPGIARLIDGGVTWGGLTGSDEAEGRSTESSASEDGSGEGGTPAGKRPYLVMELVDGTPITDYVESNGLELEARLDLLLQVAEALQAAHRQLVVHRDLKPSNVLVTETGAGAPQVKLLDFGIAKLLGDSLPVTRPQTRTGRRPMTLAYAAPEQVTGEDISTQTDVYQLGTLAYEVLTGTRPFDFQNATFGRAERSIVEKVPPKPSRRTSTEGWAQEGTQASGEIQDSGALPQSEKRSANEASSSSRPQAPESESTGGGEPPGIAAAELRGDLDTIVLKALRKEPGRRYSSAEAFAEDLRRYRRGEPIEARSTTLGYRIRKFVQRNSWAVAGVAAALVLVVGLTAFYIDRISEERNRAERQAERAQREARKAEAVSGYLTDLLQSAGPNDAGRDTTTAADLLRRGERRIERLRDQPAVQARMLQLLGNAHLQRNNYGKATRLLRRSLTIRDSIHEGAHRHLANIIEQMAHLQRQRGNYREADSLWQKALAQHRGLFGPRSPKLWEPLNGLGIVAQKQGRHERAQRFFREALSVQPLSSGRAKGDFGDSSPVDSTDIAATMTNLARTYGQLGKHTQADSLYRKVISIERQLYDPPHAQLAATYANLGLLRMNQGQFERADSALSESLSAFRAVFESPRRVTSIVLNNLAVSATKQGRLERADSLFQESLSIAERVLDSSHPQNGRVLKNYGKLRLRENRYADAEALFRRARSILRAQVPDDHVALAETEHGLGQALTKLGRYREAEPLLRRSLKAFRDKGNTEKVQEVRGDLASLYAEWDKPGKKDQYRSSG